MRLRASFFGVVASSLLAPAVLANPIPQPFSYQTFESRTSSPDDMMTEARTYFEKAYPLLSPHGIAAICSTLEKDVLGAQEAFEKAEVVQVTKTGDLILKTDEHKTQTVDAALVPSLIPTLMSDFLASAKDARQGNLQSKVLCPVQVFFYNTATKAERAGRLYEFSQLPVSAQKQELMKFRQDPLIKAYTP